MLRKHDLCKLIHTVCKVAAVHNERRCNGEKQNYKLYVSKKTTIFKINVQNILCKQYYQLINQFYENNKIIQPQ